MSFLGHWSTTAPHSHCAQQLQRQFLLLLTSDLLFFLTLYILSDPDNLISLHPIDLFKESFGHKGDTWGVENNMNMVTNSTLSCGKCSVYKRTSQRREFLFKHCHRNHAGTP